MITLTVDSTVAMGTIDLPGHVLSLIQDRLTFPNPQHQENERRGFSNWNTPRYLHGYTMRGDMMIIPRGFIHQLLTILKGAGIKYHLDDRRRALSEVKFSFNGTLRDFQETAVKAVLARSFGVLDAPTGSGKTVMALAVIAERKQPTLIIVHTKELMSQWIERINSFLGIPSEEIGVIGSGKMRIGRITVGIINSVYPVASEIRKYFGFLVVDECHRCPSRTFTEAVSSFDSRYMLGLSATPYRRDQLTRLIWWHCGDLIHKVDRKALVDEGHIIQADVITRETGFATRMDPKEQYSRVLSELTEDQERNKLIVDDVTREATEGSGICLVLTDRKSHCETLARLINQRGIKTDILTGDLGRKDRERIVSELNNGIIPVLVATGQLIGEGFDCKGLSTLFLATPIRFDGRLIQYLGRVLRPAPGKDKARVYDYADIKIGVLRNAARARARTFSRVQVEEVAA